MRGVSTRNRHTPNPGLTEDPLQQWGEHPWEVGICARALPRRGQCEDLQKRWASLETQSIGPHFRPIKWKRLSHRTSQCERSCAGAQRACLSLLPESGTPVPLSLRFSLLTCEMG